MMVRGSLSRISPSAGMAHRSCSNPRPCRVSGDWRLSHAVRITNGVSVGGHVLGRIAKQLRVVTRESEITWRYGYHLPDVLKYRLQRPATLSSEVLRVAEELNQKGVARTSVGARLASDRIYEELRQEVGELQRTRASDLARVRSGENQGAHKTY